MNASASIAKTILGSIIGPFRWVILPCLIMSFVALSSAYGEDQAANPQASQTISHEDIRQLIDLLENDEKRRAFTDNLRNLLKLKEGKEITGKDTAAAPPTSPDAAEAIENLSDQLGDVSRKISRELPAPRLWVHYFQRIVTVSVDLIKDPAGRYHLFLVLLGLTVGVLAGQILSRFLKKYAPHDPERITSRGWEPLIAFFIRPLPYLGAALVVWGIFSFHPILPRLQQLVLLSLFITWVYKAGRILGLYLLTSPERGKRVFQLNDDEAAYVYKWWIRFLRYSALYFFITLGPLDWVWDEQFFFFGNITLLVVYPLMFTVFTHRLAKLLRNNRGLDKYEEPDTGAPTTRSFFKKLMDLDFKYWDTIVIIHAWALFFFLILRRETDLSYIGIVALGSMATVSGWVFSYIGVGFIYRKLFPDSETADIIMPKLLFAGIKIILSGIAITILAEIWGVPLAQILSGKFFDFTMDRAVSIAITLIVVAFVIKGSQVAALWFLEDRPGHELTRQQKTITPIVKTAVQVTTLFIGAVILLDQIGLDIKPILTGAGIAGLAIGLGAQSLIKDVINGLFLLFEDIISVGDWAVVGDKNGLVERVGLRSVRLRDLANNVHLIPNSSIESITNMTKIYSSYVFDIGVSYREDVDEVIQVMADVGLEMQNDPAFGSIIIRGLEIFGVDRFEDSAVIIKARVTTKPMSQWAVGREYNRRLKKRFDELGIEIPFPHRTLYMGQLKEGLPPPLYISKLQDKLDQGKQGNDSGETVPEEGDPGEDLGKP